MYSQIKNSEKRALRKTHYLFDDFFIHIYEYRKIPILVPGIFINFRRKYQGTKWENSQNGDHLHF